jgi:hypothetical protein
VVGFAQQTPGLLYSLNRGECDLVVPGSVLDANGGRRSQQSDMCLKTRHRALRSIRRERDSCLSAASVHWFVAGDGGQHKQIRVFRKSLGS